MNEPRTDEGLLARIKRLVDEEHALYGRDSLDNSGQVRLDALKVELDQCWDLLRQRRARREFGDDPNQAHVRPPKIVENYEQ
jgi:Protein of unknown function (DUF2630)